MAVNKAFYKFMDSDFGRNLMRREGKFISIVTIPVRTKFCPSMVSVVQHVSQTQGSCLFPLRNDAVRFTVGI